MTKAVAARFSASAGTYAGHAAVQEAVAEHLISVLEEAPLPPVLGAILEIGCGTGLLTRLIRRRYPSAWLCAVDVAERMTMAAACTQPPHCGLAYVVADIRRFAARRRFGLVVSSSSLHWVRPLDAALSDAAGLLAPEGVLAASLMVEGTLGELHEARRRVAPGKTPAVTLPTVADVEAAVQRSGLDILEMRQESVRALYPTAKEFLGSIHRQGLTGGPVSSSGVPLTRGELARLTREYERAYRQDEQGVVATYEVVYVTAARRPTR